MKTLPKEKWIQLMERVRKGDVPPILWLHGEDQGKIRNLLEDLRSCLIPEPARSFNYVLLDAHEVSLERILEMARCLPMLSGRKLVVVYNASELSKGALEGSWNYFQSPCTTSCLVFWAVKPPPSEKLSRVLEERQALIEFKARSELGAQAWVRARLRKEGWDITAEACRALIQRVGTLEGDLEGEIQKLMAFVGEQRLIQDSDVEDVAAEARSNTLFELTDALSENRTGDGICILHRILDRGTPPLAVIGMLARQIRLLLVAATSRKGSPTAGEPHLPRFVWERLLRQAKAWSEPRLLAALEALMEVDSGMKKGRLNPEVLLDQWAIKVALSKGAISREKGSTHHQEVGF